MYWCEHISGKKANAELYRTYYFYIYILINQFYVYVCFGCMYVWIPQGAGKVRRYFGPKERLQRL